MRLSTIGLVLMVLYALAVAGLFAALIPFQWDYDLPLYGRDRLAADSILSAVGLALGLLLSSFGTLAVRYGLPKGGTALLIIGLFGAAFFNSPFALLLGLPTLALAIGTLWIASVERVT